MLIVTLTVIVTLIFKLFVVLLRLIPATRPTLRISCRARRQRSMCRMHPPITDSHRPWISSRGPATCTGMPTKGARIAGARWGSRYRDV